MFFQIRLVFGSEIKSFIIGKATVVCSSLSMVIGNKSG